MKFDKTILDIDCDAKADSIAHFIHQNVREMRREGTVIGLSGGIDSALSAALCVRSLGKDRVYGLILPEKESSPKSELYARKHAQELGIRFDSLDITPALEGLGTYRKRDEIIQGIFPGYTTECRIKISLPADLLARNALNFFTLTMQDMDGKVKTARLTKDQLNGIVAATNTKQRMRMIGLYYYAEKMNYLVCGTTNKSETIQGFFVKYGDGGVDIEPLAQLYKTQVYRLAEYVGVIEEIQQRAPSPDTYSFEVSDEEFFFRVPFDKLDLLLYAWENEVPQIEVCAALDLEEAQVKRVYRDFTSKFNASKHMRQFPPSL